MFELIKEFTVEMCKGLSGTILRGEYVHIYNSER